MINNVLCTINMAAIAEALVLGKKAGLDPEKLFSSVSMGTGQSWVLDNFGKILLERQPGQKATRMRSHEKQLAWAFQIASELEVPIPVTACAHELTKIAHAAGKCGSYEAIIELWEDITGTFFSKNA